jgi:sulfite reductase (ferredoxin)
MTPPSSTPSRPSKVEVAKENSQYLRGTVAERLEADTDRFGGTDVHVLKFHGIYEQEDRDVRREARKTGGDKKYMFMIRSKVPGGVLTGEQYLVHDDLAGEYANGSLRITTRQDFQLHGTLKHDLQTVIRAVNEAHVTTLGACGDISRNVMACPAPGSDAVREQVSRLARELSDHLLPRTLAYQEIWLNGEKAVSIGEETEPFYGPTYLPRKFKVAFALPGDNCVDVYSQDLGLVPIARGDVLEGFTVLVGGGMGVTHGMEKTYPRVGTPLGTVAPDQLLAVAEAIIAVQRDNGNRSDRKRARLKYLLDERGVEWFREQVEERLGWRLNDPAPIGAWEVDDHLGWHEQGDGQWFLGVHVENGRVIDSGSARMRTALRSLIEQYKPDVRLTAQQNILLTDIDAADRPAIDALLAEHDVRPAESLSPTFRAAMACPAMPTCGLALAEAERALPQVIRALEAELDRLGLGEERISVRMTGCPNGCARPFLGDIGLVGKTADHYQIYLGGDFEGTRLNRLFAEMVHEDEVVSTLSPIFSSFRDERVADESFGDYCNRTGEGLEKLRTEAAPVA